ncbi:MAG TPA: tetratricopeptide repeat protein [Opitutales bacterium]|jgi:tetratricopeptide (TPR) repeat protein|nr:tetratricopeptide repeat protein [Opitutales bacterium]
MQSQTAAATSSSESPPPPALRAGPSRLQLALAGLFIAVIIALAYSNSLLVPFYFDDREAITENDSITTLWPSFDEHGMHWNAISPPNEHVAGALGRPLVNLSLAVNYQIAKSLSAADNKKILGLLGQKYADSQSKEDDHNGLAVWNYHVLNIIFHIIAAWLLLGVVRRTLLQPALAPRFGADAFGLAFCAAAIWAAHPLLTEVVTCVIQRNEAMVGIFYLLALYCFIRSANSDQARWWRFSAVAACYLGVAAKELMFSAPIIILLYDRTFVAGTFRKAWIERRGFYGAMISSWALLGFLMYSAGQRGGTVGFNLDMTPWSYALKQCQAVVHYFYLAFWPHPLVMDYGADIITNFWLVWRQAIILTVLVGCTFWALWRKPAIGLAGAWIFLILAPSSSIVPLTTQTMAEHRMYLPLVPFVLLVVLGLYRFAGRSSFLPLGALALLLAALSYSRNRDYGAELSSQPYASEYKIWSVTAKQLPLNKRAQYNKGWSLIGQDRYEEAIPAFKAAIAIDPNYGDAHDNLGLCYIRLSEYDLAISEFRKAIAIDKTENKDYQSHFNLGCAYLDQNDWSGALDEFKIAVDIDASYADAQASYGSVLLHFGRAEEAITPLYAATLLDPKNASTWTDYGDALTRADRPAEAISAYQKVIVLTKSGAGSADIHKKLAVAYAANGQLDDATDEDTAAATLDHTDAEPHYLLGSHLVALGRPEEAMAEFTKAISLRSDYPEAENSLGSVLVFLNRPDEAELAYKVAIKSSPDFQEAHFNLGTLYLKASKQPGADSAAKLASAEQEIRRAIEINSDYAEAHNTLGSILLDQGKTNEALQEFQQAVRLDATFTDAKHNLDALQAALGKATTN